MQQVLETGKWPFAIFEGTPLSIVKTDSTVTSYRVVTKGKMSLHGVQKDIEIPGLLTVENGKIRIKSSFRVKLSDFQIKAPSLVAFVKVNDDITIDLDFYLKNVK
ncbi:MAG: YceI family protein [candidate division Zixibacteria bacterium]|nr:YceI family protein [candidate division Zixibacteria bacterium]